MLNAQTYVYALEIYRICFLGNATFSFDLVRLIQFLRYLQNLKH
jgi:hypothetical protein